MTMNITEANAVNTVLHWAMGPKVAYPGGQAVTDADATQAAQALAAKANKVLMAGLRPGQVTLKRRPAHDPDEPCTCEPGDLMGKGICEYRMLADTIGTLLNPPDGDEAEVSILMTAVERAQAYIESQPCTCTAEDIADQMPCGRCAALGRLANQALDR
jgi:hypothetical protein